MDSILHFFFSLRLLFSLLSELISITVKLSIGSITFLTTVLFSAFIIVGNTFTPPTVQVEVIELVDRQRAETQIAYWEGLVAISPTRDGFLNLEKLYRYIEDEETAVIYRKRAIELDPNNEEFAEDVLVLPDTNMEKFAPQTPTLQPIQAIEASKEAIPQL